jgi:hypothetical protein
MDTDSSSRKQLKKPVRKGSKRVGQYGATGSDDDSQQHTVSDIHVYTSIDKHCKAARCRAMPCCLVSD